MHNIIVIGAVNSTAEIIKSLVKHDLKPKGVLGFQPVETTNVSGWADLEEISEKLDIPFKPFQKINEPENLDWAKSFKPDIIFAVGFSQLLKDDWLEMPKLGCVGFHPTKLPKGRGRAPIAWLILEENEGASNFFLMGEGADDGPVFVQKPFSIDKEDDATTVEEKILISLNEALDSWLPKLKKGEWNPIPQDNAKATWYGKRTPEDGIIEWQQSAESIDRLVKASTEPHPGSYSYYNYEKIIVWESAVERELNIKGVVGRVLLKDKNKGVLVQCGEGLLWLRKVSIDINEIKIGQQLGFVPQIEIEKIWKEIKKLKNE
ncbi:MAG: formyltransferase family protein [Balneolaceae bacterium]